MSSKGSDNDPASELQFPIVGIGASAGGLDAFKQFISSIPEESGMAYVFVQHLNPNHESLLPELLQKSSKIPVNKITDNIHLERDNVYIIPPNKILTATDGVLKLGPLLEQQPKVKVIDLFFTSIAIVYQSFAVGIILSGTLDDGTVGLQMIKAYGGITFAQDEASAAFEGMPNNAVKRGVVDFVLSPEKIAEHLLSISHLFPGDNADNGVSNIAAKKDIEIFKQLLTVMRVRRGVDFTYYKPATLKRRIVRRMALNAIKMPVDYLEFLRESKAEQDALYNDLLISVTHFFRDPGTFEMLCSKIFPSVIEQKNDKESIRIWVAGCATGEEAYSMAICLQEYLGNNAVSMKIQIFATDVSETAIAKARTGIYRPGDMEGLSATRLQQFFTKMDGSYQVNKEIRDMCVFAQHNLLKDPPFSKMDLISCRNVMIYLEPVLQKRALTIFHYALNERGYLVLGKSESVITSSEMFSVHNHREKIFRRQGARGRFMQVASRDIEENFRDIDKKIEKDDVKKDVFKTADDIVLANYAPSGFLVNEQFDIIQFRGKTDTWIDPSPGKASLDVLKMIRGGLAFELRGLLLQAKKTNANARKENILFKSNDFQSYVNIDVIPVAGTELHYLILFEHNVASSQPVKALTKGQTKSLDNEAELLLEIDRLKKELLQTRIDMRTITEEQEAFNEELQSANQELLSSSEELQSLNEELETSTEELQSTNEEITVVNNELLDRNDQLNNARAYTEGIINTIRDPLVILDKDLKVMRATDGFYQTFKVNEKETEGQYFYELGNRQWNIPALRNLLEQVLPEKKVLTDFEVIHVFPSIGRKVMCLNTRQLERVNGESMILLAIADITDKRKVEEGLAEVELLFKESKERLKLAVDAAGLGTWDYNPLSKELIWDSRCKEMFGLLPQDKIAYDQFIDLIDTDYKADVDINFKRVLTGANNGEYDTEFKLQETEHNKPTWVKFKGKVYFNDQKLAYRFVGTSLDITAQKVIDEATLELLKKKDDFMSIASHELKTPITTLKASLQLLSRMKNDPNAKMLPTLIERANKSMEKVSALIEDLLNVSKLNQGQLRLNKKRFLLSQAVEECCSHIRMEDLYNVKVTGNLELEVYADQDRVDQVIINFINNAVKYAPESKEIVVTIEKEVNMAKVSVIDKGPGIPAAGLPYLFERYYRVDNTGNTYSGLGLGLYICSEIIKKHGGNIGVDSEFGNGSTFWFTLPL